VSPVTNVTGERLHQKGGNTISCPAQVFHYGDTRCVRYDTLLVDLLMNMINFIALRFVYRRQMVQNASIVEALSGGVYLDQLEAITVCCCSFVRSSESILLRVSGFKCVRVSLSL